tara:strand:+ start:60 stop:1547 length:1488 start_codon:yes stop_codon:yes gene_type:complete
MRILFLIFLFFLLIKCDFDEKNIDPVLSLGLNHLEIISKNNIFFPEFDTDIMHYGASLESDSSITLFVSAKNANTEIYINNKFIGIGSTDYNFESLMHNENIVIELKNKNKFLKYYIHNVSNNDPKIEVVKKTNLIDHGFILINPRMQIDGIIKTFLLIIDNNGVIRFKKVVDGIASDFKKHPNGKYSYASRNSKNEFNNWTSEIVILNRYFQEENKIECINLNHTDNHDFLITQSGTYMLLSYHTNYRDFSSFGYSEKEPVRDSYIQEISKDGNIIFEWNSWDNIDINGCLNHRFPDDYAHINSIQIAPDGNIIASFRGCSSILKIDRLSGQTIWSIGGADPSLKIEGDIYGEFCGQHTASESEDGFLYIFDNGGHCNGEREDKFGTFSRALQYKLNLNLSKVTFVRDYSFKNEYKEYSTSGGSFFVTNNGNWLINWSRGINTITEVSENNEIAFEFNIKNDSVNLRSYRAYRIYDTELPINLNGDFIFEKFKN